MILITKYSDIWIHGLIPSYIYNMWWYIIIATPYSLQQYKMSLVDTWYSKFYVPLINDFSIKTVCMSVNNPQENALVDWSHQFIYKVIVTKYISNKIFNYIDKETVVLQLLGTSCWYRDNCITKLWAHSSYFLYLYMVFLQHFFHSEQHFFHVLWTFRTDWV